MQTISGKPMQGPGIAGAVAAIAFTPSALAGEGAAGSITFSPTSAAAIPTLGSALLVLLAGLLALIALKSYRHTRGMTPTIAGMLTIAALASTGGGINLLREVQAGIPATPVTESGGQTLTLDAAPNIFRNDAGTTLGVSNIEILGECSVASNEFAEPDCTEGLVLEDGDLCAITVDCFFDSDMRLKTDISPTGLAANGLPLYRFRYRDGSRYYEGVMAQDVLAFMPEAVAQNADGYYAVNYHRLGLSLRRVK